MSQNSTGRLAFPGRLKVWQVVLLLAMMLPLLAGCEKKEEKKEILIGGTLSQSGPFQGITRPFQKFADAFAEHINSKGGVKLSKMNTSLPIRFVIYDDQTDTATALKFYEKMATVDKVDIFIGPFSSLLTNAAVQAAKTHKIPFFMVEANDSIMFTEANPWATTGLTRAQDEYKRHADFYLKKKGVKTFALLARDNLHENQAMEGFGEWLKKHGFQVVYQNIAPKDTKDFSSVILAIKQKNPDAVFVEALAPPWNIGFLKQARSLGLKPKEMIVGHVPVPVIKAMGESSENIVSTLYSYDGDTEDHKLFNELVAKTGFEPWQFSELGIRFSAFVRIIHALEQAGTTDKEAVRKAMWETNMKIWGEEEKHDQLGYGTIHPWPTQIKGGKHVSLWPLEKGVQIHQPKAGKW